MYLYREREREREKKNISYTICIFILSRYKRIRYRIVSLEQPSTTVYRHLIKRVQ